MDNYYSRWFFLTLATHQECQNWSGILQEFCYYANAIFLVMLLFYPRNEKLFMVCFSFAEVRKWFQFVFGQSQCLYSSLFLPFSICWIWLQGPLAWALIVWRCSLVFNSADKLVSVLIHLFPGELILPLPFYLIRMLLEKECYLCIWNSIYTEKGKKKHCLPLYLTLPCALGDIWYLQH